MPNPPEPHSSQTSGLPPWITEPIEAALIAAMEMHLLEGDHGGLACDLAWWSEWVWHHPACPNAEDYQHSTAELEAVDVWLLDLWTDLIDSLDPEERDRLASRD